MEYNIHACISIHVKTIKLLSKSLWESKELLVNMLWQQSDFGLQDLINFQNHLQETLHLQTQLILEMNPLLPQIQVICKIVDDISEKDMNPFHRQLEETYTKLFKMLCLCSRDLIEESVVLLLNNGMNNGRQFLNEMLDDIYANMKSLGVIAKLLALFIISKVDDNQELYKLHQPQLNGTEEDKCVICTKSVNPYQYAKFADCNHKLCFTCISTYLPKQGKCPFDGRVSVEFVICQREQSGIEHVESVRRYIITNYEAYGMDRIRPMVVHNIRLLDEILQFNIYTPSLLKILRQFSAETSQPRQKELLRPLVKTFLDIANNKFVRFDNISWVGIESEIDVTYFEIGRFREMTTIDGKIIILRDLIFYCIDILRSLAGSMVKVLRYDLDVYFNFIRSSLDKLLHSFRKLEF